MKEDIIFKSPTGYITFTSHMLAKYPNCLLNRFANGPMRSRFDPTTNVYQTELDLQTLKSIKYFLINGIWKNPYLIGNQLNAIPGNHEMNCEYLILPADPIEEVPGDSKYDQELYDEYNWELEDDIYHLEKIVKINDYRFDNDYMNIMIDRLDAKSDYINVHWS